MRPGTIPAFLGVVDEAVVREHQPLGPAAAAAGGGQKLISLLLAAAMALPMTGCVQIAIVGGEDGPTEIQPRSRASDLVM